MVLDELFEKPHAPAGAPAFVDVGLWRAQRGAGDIKMRPWRLADETLQQLCGGDRTTGPTAGIFHIGEFRVDHLVVFGTERHAPYPLAGRLSWLGEAPGK